MPTTTTIRLSLTLVLFAAATLLFAMAPVAHAQSAPGEALFVTAEVDNERPFLGQQITYTLKIYEQSGTTLASRRVRYEAPGFAGFWNSQVTEQNEQSETLDSIEYRVVELQTVLFPSVVGIVYIDPAALSVSAETGAAESRLESNTLVVEVRPLPAKAPAEFSGAVGRFEVSAVSDATQGRVNEPVRLTVRITGEGNVEALPDPEWPEFNGWRVIESPVSSESRIVAGVITGNRTYEFTLVPEVEGELIIPEIRYPHFNPVSGQYEPAVTAPISVSAASGGGLSPLAQIPEAESAEEEEGLRPIKEVPTSLRRGGSNLADSRVFWAAWAIPVLIVVGAVAWRRRQTAQESARSEALRHRALPDALAALGRARGTGTDTRQASAEAVLAYLAARLGTEVIGLTREALLRRLRDAGVPQELEDRLDEVLTAGESARYTPGDVRSAEAGNHAEIASQLLTELEEAISA